MKFYSQKKLEANTFSHFFQISALKASNDLVVKKIQLFQLLTGQREFVHTWPSDEKLTECVRSAIMILDRAIPQTSSR